MLVKLTQRGKKSQNSCYGLNFVSYLPHPPKSMQYIEILPSKVTVLKDGAFGRCLPHESGGLLGGISAAIEKAQRPLYPLCPARTQQEGATYAPGRGPSPACDFAGALVLASSFQSCGKCISVAYKPPSVVFCYSCPNRLKTSPDRLKNIKDNRSGIRKSTHGIRGWNRFTNEIYQLLKAQIPVMWEFYFKTEEVKTRPPQNTCYRIGITLILKPGTTLI